VEPLVNELVVCRNDSINLTDVASFDKIIISPGPALPNEAGQLMDLIKMYHSKIPILGICLGFQAIVEFFGGELVNMMPVRHGLTKEINVIKDVFFEGVPSKITVGLYHSWGVYVNSLPKCFRCLAKDQDQIVMAIAHDTHPIYGLQYHPESIMTGFGHQTLKNWVNLK
jgi:anthranilate synthase component 2